jgi:elongation factor 3
MEEFYSKFLIVIVSHDSGFLNHTITDVLHLNRFKVRRYKGNLESFVKQVPEAKSYYTLEAAEDYRFKLPDPPLLEGVKTKEKSLLKMRKVGFQYPTQPVQQLYDITLQVSLSSRVAVLGPNGSGKSTLVKLLIGDMEANKGGEIWKHPNLVIGYVAQHAFHHIDNHLDKTPLEYMLWRYQTGEDLEEMTKANRQISEEELQKMKDGALVIVEGQKRLIDEIIARKKLKQSYEYEVSFKGLSSSENIWLPRDDLIKRGFEKVRSSCHLSVWISLTSLILNRKSSKSIPARLNAWVFSAPLFVGKSRSTSLTSVLSLSLFPIIP